MNILGLDAAEIDRLVQEGEQRSVDNTAKAYGTGSGQHLAAIRQMEERATLRASVRGNR